MPCGLRVNAYVVAGLQRALSAAVRLLRAVLRLCPAADLVDAVGRNLARRVLVRELGRPGTVPGWNQRTTPTYR